MARAERSALSVFSAAARGWFEASYAEPTPAQAAAWPAIAAGENVLLSAPTGSGKTLAAFLWALDRLSSPRPERGGQGAQGTSASESDVAAESVVAAESDVAAEGDVAPEIVVAPESDVAAEGVVAAEGDVAAESWVAAAGRDGVRVVYVSPLKALSYDIERNLRAPLRGIGADVSVGIRTGDTSQSERAAMARKPPQILITTPESLYLILSSRARSMLSTVETVIVDEIHAVAAGKRGSHLALTLERLQRQVREAGFTREIQRVGLSATQRPLDEIGRFLVGRGRDVRIVDASAPKPLDLRIEVPVESMTELDAVAADPLEPSAGGDADRRSTAHSEHAAGSPIGQRNSPVPERGIWPAIYPELLRLVREHRSTIVFVNNRRSAERVALRLNELAQDEIARAHHGSLAREERSSVEEQLKAGTLPCLVATSSLELGIDMGAVDLVLQVESPKSVARGLQRIGRAGHGVGDVSKGRIFPKFRGDLLECAVVCRRMREGEIEPTVVPRNALDVLAQQIVAIAASANDSATSAAVREKAVATQPRGTVDAAGPRDTAGAGDAVSRDDGADAAVSPDTGPGGVPAEQDGVSVDELYELVTASYPYSELPRALFENVLDMLDGRYPSSEFGELRARIVWDRLAGRVRARRGARQLAVANAGTIPDRGLYAVTLPDGRRVGELDEEMVYEARAGQVFALGASSWRIEQIERDRVIVTPAPGVPGAVPFWKGDGIGRPMQLGRAIGEFARWAVGQEPQALARDGDLDERSARNLLDYLQEQQQSTRVLPSDRTIVLERFRDEIGDWRLCLLSPYGGRVHAAWALAISARFRELFGIDGEVLWSDDGIVMRLPDADLEGIAGDAGLDGYDPDSGGPGGDWERSTASSADALAGGWERSVGSSRDVGARSYAELVALDPDEVQEAIVSELGESALFGARFRENAARALLIPRAYPGRRTPLWQQRLKSQALLQVARRYADFPIVLETYRECLHDVLDVDGLRQLLRALATREIALVEVQTQSPSPFAGSLLFDYIATYMYEGDAPAAERRAAALALDRDLLRELLGQEELRELIDPQALARVADDLQCRSPLRQATDADSLHDVLRRIGDLTIEELGERTLAELDAAAMLATLERERRAIRVRIAGQERAIAADDAALYRDALGVPPPGGLPGRFLAEVPDPLTRLVERYARTHPPFKTAELRARYGVDPSAPLRELERAGALVRGSLLPDPVGAGESEWCDVEVLRALRRASLAALRREIEPVPARALAAFMPSWQGVDRYRSDRGPRRDAGGAVGVERLREALLPLQALALPAAAWERDVLPARTGSYSPSWLDELCAAGEIVWVGAGALGRTSGRVALYFREDAPLLPLPPGVAADPPAGDLHALLRERLRLSPAFFTDLLADLQLSPPVLAEALWDLVWAGEATSDAYAPVRAPRRPLPAVRPLAAPPARRFGGSFARRSGRSQPSPMAGRWSLTESIFREQGRWPARPPDSAGPSSPRADDPAKRSGHAPPSPPLPDRRAQLRALAELLLERYGLLTREQVLAEGVPGGFAALYGPLSDLETLGICRRGYFVEGLGAAQFALPGAVERLRSPACAREPTATVLSAVDPAQPYGAALPWPKRPPGARRPTRTDGAYVVLVDAEPILYLERGARSIVTLSPDSPASPSPPPRATELALRALSEAVCSGRIGAIALERFDGAPAIGSALEPTLVELGFRSGPRRLTLRA